MGLPGTGANIVLPSSQNVIDSFLAELNRFISGEIQPQIERIQSEIERTDGSSRSINKLGVLYGRYGLYPQALGEFARVLESEEYFPTLINMGNIYFLNKEWDDALECYRRGYALSPENPACLLSLARTNYALGNLDSTAELYNSLKERDPDLAERFAYLGGQEEGAARAADMGGPGDTVIWEEGE